VFSFVVRENQRYLAIILGILIGIEIRTQRLVFETQQWTAKGVAEKLIDGTLNDFPQRNDTFGIGS
jgi:hypothetical protein